MEVTKEMYRRWEEQAQIEREPQHRCSNCRHFLPAELERDGLYTGDDGHCRIVATLVSNAHRTWCEGWQSDIGNRREEVTRKAQAGPPIAAADMKHACQWIRKLSRDAAVKKASKLAARKWANEHAPPESPVRRDA